MKKTDKQLQQEVTEMMTDDDGKLTGVKTYSGAVYNC